jgi:hypothetical protein
MAFQSMSSYSKSSKLSHHTQVPSTSINFHQLPNFHPFPSVSLTEAFIFIMLTILGNSDVSVIYTVAPLLGTSSEPRAE